jgi:hypothetical protein
MCAVERGGNLTGIEERVRQYLIERAKSTDPAHPFQSKITYGDLCGAIDPDQHYWSYPRFRGIGTVLGRVSTVEHDQGRPMLSALVVQAVSLKVGKGFAGLGRDLGFQIQPGEEQAFWRNQLEDVVRYWTGDGKETGDYAPKDRALALLANISDEVTEVRRLLSASQR